MEGTAKEIMELIKLMDERNQMKKPNYTYPTTVNPPYSPWWGINSPPPTSTTTSGDPYIGTGSVTTSGTGQIKYLTTTNV